jgi:thioredoxin 1
MKSAFFLVFTIACTCLRGEETAKSDTRNQDLKAIIEHTTLSPEVDLLFNMLILGATTESQKTVDVEEIIEKFRKSCEEEAILAQFTASYSVFSDDEIHELRKMVENPLYTKYSVHAGQQWQADIQVMKGLFKDLVDQYGVLKADDDFSLLSEIVEVTSENFQREVAESQKPVIIDFYSSSCPPCRLMEPIMEELSHAYAGEICFVKINCDTQNEIAQRYKVSGLPTFVFLRPAEEKAFMKCSGFTSKRDFLSKIAALLESVKE